MKMEIFYQIFNAWVFLNMGCFLIKLQNMKILIINQFKTKIKPFFSTKKIWQKITFLAIVCPNCHILTQIFTQISLIPIYKCFFWFYLYVSEFFYIFYLKTYCDGATYCKKGIGPVTWLKFGPVSDVRFKLCQAEKPSPIRDCDGIPRVGQGAVGHFPSCMIWYDMS